MILLLGAWRWQHRPSLQSSHFVRIVKGHCSGGGEKRARLKSTITSGPAPASCNTAEKHPHAQSRTGHIRLRQPPAGQGRPTRQRGSSRLPWEGDVQNRNSTSSRQGSAGRASRPDAPTVLPSPTSARPALTPPLCQRPLSAHAPR